MSAEKQYIELYRSQKSLIDAHAAPVLNACREEAARVLAEVGLQRAKDFTHVDPEEVLADDYALNLARHEVPTSREDLFTCAVPELSTQVHFLVNEQYVALKEQRAATKTSDAASGYFCGSLREFAVSYPEVAARYYNQLASKRTDTGNERSKRYEACSLGESALNTMLCQDGFVLYVPDGVHLDKPVQLISLLRAVDNLMAVQRLLIILEADAQASLLVCEHASQLQESVKLLSLQTTEVFVGPRATLDLYCLEEHHAMVTRLGQLYVRQEADSNVAIGQYALTTGRTRNRIQVLLAEEGAQLSLYGMATLDEEQQLDNLTFIDHQAPQCTCNELFKYVLDNQARGSFLGRILVREGSDKTDAHQTDRNLCLTPEARMVARPELEIYADDVKCSHGATVGQLDQQALFYMRTRGIPEAEARLLLMFAFMADVIDGIRIEPVRDRLRHLVEKRFRGELTQCKGCAIR
ncbi:MAG: Fe-S cluster assembly protein SufD [Bacteroidales bacterium]|nr:Fe-S cluster assembly protein SufD [Bacteroidales bacterium]MBP5679688.1 Fe-S cluster assembly protein SufD [Bacteroidales bacterium]